MTKDDQIKGMSQLNRGSVGFQEALAKQEQGEQETLAYREAASLAKWLFNKHFAHEEHYASGRVVWGLCDTTAGVISQIDNMVCKLVREQEQGEPVAQCCSAGIAHDCHAGDGCRIVERIKSAPQPKQEPVTFLANGTRFKIIYDSRQSGGQIHGIPPELGGRWVAFVAADDDCHLKLTTPQPAQKPMADEYAAFKEYLKDCDQHLINPDVGGAFHFAWQASKLKEMKNG